eukprot:13905325-Heterocapsa_arctica.AAC.1
MQAAMMSSSTTAGGSGARKGAFTMSSQTLSKQPNAGRRTAKSETQRPTTLCSHLSLQVGCKMIHAVMATCERSLSMPIEARPAQPSTNRPLRFAWRQRSVSLPPAQLTP